MVAQHSDCPNIWTQNKLAAELEEQDSGFPDGLWHMWVGNGMGTQEKLSIQTLHAQLPFQRNKTLGQ